MSRQALSRALLLLVVTVPLRAADADKGASADSGDSWAPLSHTAPAATPASFPEPSHASIGLKRESKTAKDHPPAGFHDVNVGGAVIRVADEVKAVGEFGRTSTFSGKTFSADESSLSKSVEAPEVQQKPFTLGSAYGTSDYKQSDHTFQTAAYHSDARSSNDFAKTYALPKDSTSFDRPYAVKSSNLQDKSALVAQQPSKTDPFNKPWTDGTKQFYDPALRKVKHDPYASGLDVSRVADLPNRPLTIDEVRALINHEQAPDLNSKPEEGSRPLNDPTWEPPLKLPEASDKGAPATPPPDEAKDGELPSPGMMAQPAGDGTLPPQK